MNSEQIDTLLAETAAALEGDAVAPLSEAELQVSQRTLAPLNELIEVRWRQLRPGGPERLREAAAGRGAEVEARAELVRLQREQLAAQLETLAQRRRVARRREALNALPQNYADTALAVAALETAWAAFESAVNAVNGCAQTVATCRRNAGDACPDAPTEAEALPARIAAVSRQIGARAHGIVRWAGDFGDACGIEDTAASARHFYEHV